MAPRVSVLTVEPRPLAAVRRSVRLGAVGAAWRPALDQVWVFLGRHPGLHAGGHNVFLYHHPTDRGAPMEVDFGVEVTGAFEGDGEVAFTSTPGGEAATAVHVGAYDRLGDAHDAIHAWASANGRRFAGCSWEIYGDWTDDAARLETTVGYLLRQR